MNRILLGLLAVGVTACAHRPARVANPGATDSTIRSVKVDTTQPDANAALQRAARAADEVDTIVVQPDSIVLHVGQAFAPWGIIKIEARNATGTRVADFAPFMDVEDRSIVEFRGTDFVGRRVGRTRLVITPMTQDESARARAPRAFITFRVDP